MKAENGLKKCSKCGDVKGVEEYYKCSASSDKLKGICKLCLKPYNAKYKTQNKDSITDRRRKWSENNKDKLKQYREKQKPYRYQYMIEYRLKHKEDIKEYRKEYAQRTVEKKRRSMYQWSANNRAKIAGYRRKNSETLSDSFIIQRITDKCNISAAQIRENPELIEIKRTILKTKRLCKTLKNSEVN